MYAQFLGGFFVFDGDVFLGLDRQFINNMLSFVPVPKNLHRKS